MSISPTRNRLERRRERKLLLLGMLEILTAALWSRVADIDLAEGKRALGLAEIAAAGLCFFFGVRHIKVSK